MDSRSRLQAALADRYTVERELGRGGMATVFLAQDRKHHRRVAIKVLHPELSSALGPERFLREIETVAGLTHPHILPLHDSGEADGLLYYVMPFIEGESLRARLSREKQLPLDDALRFARNVAAALAYAHSHGVVHRDIKPENILLEGDEAVVADFGIARAISVAGGERLTDTGLVVGTPAYMSPEQALGGQDLDGRSDVYSLACVLYETLAGEPPYTGPTAEAIIAKRLTGPVPRLRTVRERVPEAIDDAISTALARTPADRFSTATHFAEALMEPPAPPRRGKGVPTRTGLLWSRRRRTAIRLAVGVLLLAGVGWAISSRLSRQPTSVSPTRLAVLPFSVPSGAGLAYLGEGMVDLLSRNLDGAEDVRTIDPATVLSTVAKAVRSEGANVERSRALAQQLGAGLYVLGSVHPSGGRLRIQAALYDQKDSSAAAAQAVVEGDSTELFELVDRLSGQLLVKRRRGPGFRLTQTAALTTHSISALKSYLDGERNLRAGEGQFDSAIAGFQRAIADDTAFALAYYRLAVSAGWAGRPGISGPATERALALSSRLAERDRRLLTAFDAFQRGAANAAEQQYRAILRDYPDDLEAQFQLADVLYHYNAPRGRPMAEAREPFNQVLAVDPEFLCPI